MVSKFPPLTVGMSTKEAIELVKADKTLKVLCVEVIHPSPFEAFRFTTK